MLPWPCEPDADIEGAMGAAGAVVGAALAIGTVAGSGLVAWDPIAGVNPLVVPLLVALVLRGIELASISRLMVEPHRPPAQPDALGAPWRSSATVCGWFGAATCWRR